jgi:hypothetical protein
MHDPRPGATEGLDVMTGTPVLDLTCEDVGSCIGLVSTPARRNVFKGISQKVLSDVIADLKPVQALIWLFQML